MEEDLPDGSLPEDLRQEGVHNLHHQAEEEPEHEGVRPEFKS